MRRLAFLTVLLLLAARGAWAQTTTVSATITDAGGQAWKQGTFTFSFRTSPLNPTSIYYLNGVPLTAAQQTILGHMDTTGSFSGVSVPSNTSITPSGSTWDVQVCPISQGNTTCYTKQSITITGATQSLSSVVIPPAALIDLAHPNYPFVMAYNNAEFSTAPMGGIYYDYTQAHYFLCTNVTPSGQAQWYGTCLTWKEFCLVGDGLCAASTVNYQHNGTLVGSHPTFNIIDSGTVTATVTNDSLNNRVNMTLTALTGTGCTLPGTNFGVLSEHPIGTCFDGPHFTWDDTASRQVLQAGISNTIGATNSDVFVFGPANTVANGLNLVRVFGDNNGVTGTVGGNAYIFGTGNTLSRNGLNWLIGNSNSASDSGSNLFLIGKTNTTQSTVGGTSTNIRDCIVAGENNLLQNVAGGAQTISNCGVYGLSNKILVTATSIPGIDSTYIAGESNTLTISTNNAVNSIHILGAQNTVENTLNQTNEVEVVGELNDVNGAKSTVQILGYLNTADNVSSQGGTLVNTTLVGSANNATNTGATGTPAYQGVFGGSNSLQNCHNCWIAGDGVSLTGSNEFDIGMSASAEIKITPGVANIAIWPVSQLQTISICASGCTVTATPCTVSSGASYDVCTNSISWPNAFVDSNYTVICNGEVNSTHASPGNGSTNYALTAFAQKGSLTTTTFIVVTQNQRTNSAAFDEIDCTGTHR